MCNQLSLVPPTPQGTWPYLSRRAKLGYTKGVSQAGMRNWNTAGGADKPVTARNKKAVIFVPSKLDSCGSVGQPSAGLAAIRGSGPRVPTPPWLAADDEVEEDASTITGSSSSPCRSKGCESNHPGLGYFAPELCEISPMNEVRTFCSLQSTSPPPPRVILGCVASP
ncbi:unnamed protein product [Dicrocoelium dendriticum]|nr:unnamed protein product [Dicrocoelium dendriticum]